MKFIFTYFIIAVSLLLSACTKDADETILTEQEEQPIRMLNVTYLVTEPSSFDASDGKIDIMPQYGNPPYYYQWYYNSANHETTQDLENIKAGKYGLTVTDSKGVKVQVFITVNQPSVPVQYGCKGQTTMTDPRDGREYKIVEVDVGDCLQCWMAENLDYGTMVTDHFYPLSHAHTELNNGIIEKYCYENNPDSCKKYGGLYDYNEMRQFGESYSKIETEIRGACPEGWHLPTDQEWGKLLQKTGFDSWDSVGIYLKSKTAWGVGNGNDSLGLNMLPAGYRAYNGEFKKAGEMAWYWMLEPIESNYRMYYLDKNDNMFTSTHSTDYYRGFSVRCLKDQLSK